METKTAVFDASRPVTVNLRTQDGVKTIRVRFPGWFPRTPDAFTKDAQRLSVQFRQVFAAMSGSGSWGVGGV